MSSIAEILTDLFLIFEDLKFWKKKKARRKLEKEKGLPKKRMIYPSDRYETMAILLGLVLLSVYFFVISPILDEKSERETKNKITNLKGILDSNYIKTNELPANLVDVINNNPLERNRIIDGWDNEFIYELSEDNLKYSLISKGKDGKLNTKDDIK